MCCDPELEALSHSTTSARACKSFRPRTVRFAPRRSEFARRKNLRRVDRLVVCIVLNSCCFRRSRSKSFDE